MNLSKNTFTNYRTTLMDIKKNKSLISILRPVLALSTALVISACSFEPANEINPHSTQSINAKINENYKAVYELANQKKAAAQYNFGVAYQFGQGIHQDVYKTKD